VKDSLVRARVYADRLREVNSRLLIARVENLSVEDFDVRRVQMSQNNGHSKDGTGAGVATLAGGCFWCLEAVYEQFEGVKSVVSGYAGGHVPNPTYRQVSSGRTGHAEVVQITYDPGQVSYRDLLGVFFTIHDPTTLNRQGADVGTQYRSAIFYHDEAQKEIAEQVMHDIAEAGIWENPIVTEITPFDAFYRAEDYHQEYYRNNTYQPYCQVVIAPKVAKFRQKYLARLKPTFAAG
jgi:peptide-methionine (S)-S-oxide reductase